MQLVMPMKKDQVDLESGVVWIPDSKTRIGMAEVPLTDVALEVFQIVLADETADETGGAAETEPERE